MVMLAREDSPQARRELVNLLKSENQVADEAVRTAGGTDAVYGENYAEYYAQLQDIVMKLAEDPAYSEGLDALVMAGPEPDTKEAKWLALHGSTITPSIVKQSVSSLEFQRAAAIGLAGLILQNADGGKVSVSHKDQATLLNIIHAGLSDQDAYPRQTAVQVVGTIGRADDLPALKQIAERDPEYEVSTGQRSYTIRKAGEASIIAINARVNK